MIIFLLACYLGLLALFVWLRFIPWNTLWKLSPILVLVILNVGLFIPMGWGAPSGPVAVVRNAVAITPNVAGQVTEMQALANHPLKAGDILFRIDPAPFEHKVTALEAEVVAAERKADQLKSELDAASANVAAVTGQLRFAEQRRDDLARLTRTNAASEFRLQDEQKQVETLSAQLDAAKAQETRASLALDSQIGGVNTEVARLRAELAGARWDLGQTTVRAPTDGYVTNVALRKGARATTAAAVMAFIDTSETIIGAEIAQIDARYLKPGHPVEITFKPFPGQVFTGRVETVLQAIATGQMQVSGTAIAPTTVQAAPFVVRLTLDDHETARRLPAGSTGLAAIYTDHVTFSHVIRRVLLRQVAITNYVNPF